MKHTEIPLRRPASFLYEISALNPNMMPPNMNNKINIQIPAAVFSIISAILIRDSLNFPADEVSHDAISFCRSWLRFPPNANGMPC